MIATVVAAVLLVPAIIWIGLGYAGDPNSVKLPAVSTIEPEMKPYVLTALEKEKRLLPVTTKSVPMDPANIGTIATPGTKSGRNIGLTQADRDKLAQGKTRPHEKQLWTPEKAEPFSTIENIPRARGVEGLTPQERAKLKTYMKNQNK